MQNYLFSTIITLITISFPMPLIRLYMVLDPGNGPSQPPWCFARLDAQGLFSCQSGWWVLPILPPSPSALDPQARVALGTGRHRQRFPGSCTAGLEPFPLIAVGAERL